MNTGLVTEIFRVIYNSIRESYYFPILFLPLFVITLVSIVASSDVVVASMGASTSLWVNMMILVLLTPAAMSSTILMDRMISSEKRPNIQETVEAIREKYLLLVGANLVAWSAILLGMFMFVIPGIYLMVKLLFVNQEVMLNEKEDLESVLRSSWNITSGRWFAVFILVISLTGPLIITELLSSTSPSSWAATIQALIGTMLQTWLVIASTRLYVALRQGENKKVQDDSNPR